MNLPSKNPQMKGFTFGGKGCLRQKKDINKVPGKRGRRTEVIKKNAKCIL